MNRIQEIRTYGTRPETERIIGSYRVRANRDGRPAHFATLAEVVAQWVLGEGELDSDGHFVNPYNWGKAGTD